ncbi:hypothetical protein [uncultured Stenotrophomonas sp.]|uniref:hypothetical protein n=1 Tax=uncultured Stenotrophomonas sp. TaxID=165438 RepID=UPI0028D56EB8|nr:hypothetical protein [uncultured Stenotrophomonas sp.]
MRALIFIILGLLSESSFAQSARGSFLVSMTIAESCLVLDAGVFKCTAGMREPVVRKESAEFISQGLKIQRLITVIIY